MTTSGADKSIDQAAPSWPEAAAPVRQPLGAIYWLCIGWLGLVVVAAISADLLPLTDPLATDFVNTGVAPNSQFWLGTDALGRDVFSRVIFGSRVSLIIGILVPAISLSIGLALGLIAGFYRGWIEQVILFYVNVTFAFPGLVLLLVVLAVVGADLVVLILLFGIGGNAGAIRIARASTLTYVEREFVTAAKALGASDFRIIVYELMPNVALPLISIAMLAVSGMIVAEGTLSFLGLSVPPPAPTWGNMIAMGMDDLNDAVWVWGFPAATLFLTVLSLNIVGDLVRTRLDARESKL